MVNRSQTYTFGKCVVFLLVVATTSSTSSLLKQAYPAEEQEPAAPKSGPDSHQRTGTETGLFRVKLSFMVVDFICTVGMTLDCPDVCPNAILRVSVGEVWALIGI